MAMRRPFTHTLVPRDRAAMPDADWTPSMRTPGERLARRGNHDAIVASR
jgi:hypothetical protein